MDTAPAPPLTGGAGAAQRSGGHKGRLASLTAPQQHRAKQRQQHDAHGRRIHGAAARLAAPHRPNWETRRLVEGNTLIWTIADRTYRLETTLPLEEAPRVAESLGE